MFHPLSFGAVDGVDAGAEPPGDEPQQRKCLIDDQPMPGRQIGTSDQEPGSPNLLIGDESDQPQSPTLLIGGMDEMSKPEQTMAMTTPPTPPMFNTMMAHNSDAEDSVCADIDRWACSSLEEEEGSQQNGSARLQELEEQQQRLSESVLQLSTQFARIQFRIQQIAQAPADQRDEMIRQLQEFASRSCIDLGPLKAELFNATGSPSGKPDPERKDDSNKATQMRQLIAELRGQLAELEQFAWQNGQLGPGELPLAEQRERQRLLLERLREKMRLKVELVEAAEGKQDADTEQFRKRLEEGLEQALNPIREKDQLVGQLRTQIHDLEQYVQFLQREIAAASPETPGSPIAKVPEGKADDPLEFRAAHADAAAESGGWLFSRWWGRRGSDKGSVAAQPPQLRAHKHFERNELKHTPMGNHYGDQRAEMELAVDELAGVLRKHQILAVERPERAELSVDELNKCILEGGQEAVVASVRKRFCPALRALLEHGLRPAVAPSPKAGGGLFSAIGCFSSQQQRVNSRHLRPNLSKFDGRKLEHVWDVITLFLEASRALEMRDAVVGQLSDAFKLDTVSGKSATSKQILLCTVEHINSSHAKLRRSPDTMWKAFVCAALNRNRLPAWIRIIFRSELVLSKCYFTWSYVARTGVEDIRPLLERLHEHNFDLPVDLAVRPFEHIKEAFG